MKQSDSVWVSLLKQFVQLSFRTVRPKELHLKCSERWCGIFFAQRKYHYPPLKKRFGEKCKHVFFRVLLTLRASPKANRGFPCCRSQISKGALFIKESKLKVDGGDINEERQGQGGGKNLRNWIHNFSFSLFRHHIGLFKLCKWSKWTVFTSYRWCWLKAERRRTRGPSTAKPE